MGGAMIRFCLVEEESYKRTVRIVELSAVKIEAKSVDYGFRRNS
jgi:hypothetical protein